MNKQFMLLALGCFLVSCTTMPKQTTQQYPLTKQTTSTTDSLWTYADRRAYAMSRTDSTRWDREMFTEDLAMYKSHDWPTKPAISNYPSPVSKYEWGYCLLSNFEMEIEGKLMQGACIGNAKDKYRKLEKLDDYYKVKFNILWLTDELQDEMRAKTVISRNYPHYMSTGKQKTSLRNYQPKIFRFKFWKYNHYNTT